MSESNSDVFSEVIIAKWCDRFLAWPIDFCIISIISILLISSVFEMMDYELNEKWFLAETIQYVPMCIIFFAYWAILEYNYGQAIGKKILNLKVANIYGKSPDLKGIIISSFGKAFLLPIDVLLGWIFTNDKRQRIFSKLGDTLIIKIKNSEENKESIRYKRD